MTNARPRYRQPEAPITLLESTGADPIDRILRGLIGLIEASFPDRVRGYYLDGSYANGSAVATSDIDLRVVFKDAIEAQEKHYAMYLLECFWMIIARPVDLVFDSEAALMQIGADRFQRGTVLLYGDDSRDTVPLKPLESYVRDTVHFPFHMFVRVRGNPEYLRYPLSYPDAEGEFYGYDRRQMRLLDGTIVHCTKDLVLSAVCTATARIALEAGQYVVSKRDCVPFYRRWIDDEWTDHIAAIYETCRNQWAYLLPQDNAQRQHLRALCERQLAFENDFLVRYRGYLLQELQHPDDAIKHHAVARLARLRYDDPTIIASIESISNSDNLELRDETAKTLALYSSPKSQIPNPKSLSATPPDSCPSHA